MALYQNTNHVLYTDVIQDVLTFSTKKDLCVFARVSKNWHKAAKNLDNNRDIWKFDCRKSTLKEQFKRDWNAQKNEIIAKNQCALIEHNANTKDCTDGQQLIDITEIIYPILQIALLNGIVMYTFWFTKLANPRFCTVCLAFLTGVIICAFIFKLYRSSRNGIFIWICVCSFGYIHVDNIRTALRTNSTAQLAIVCFRLRCFSTRSLAPVYLISNELYGLVLIYVLTSDGKWSTTWCLIRLVILVFCFLFNHLLYYHRHKHSIAVLMRMEAITFLAVEILSFLDYGTMFIQLPLMILWIVINICTLGTAFTRCKTRSVKPEHPSLLAIPILS